MGEYDFTDNLVTLAKFPTLAEAAMVQSRLQDAGIDVHTDEDNVASWYAMGQASAALMVRQGDFRRAREVLEDVAIEAKDESDSDLADADAEDWDVDDWSGEDWADDSEEEDYEAYSEEPTVSHPLSRAWRASVIGAIVLPLTLVVGPIALFLFGLNVYSLWLIVEHRLWEPQRGETGTNWRFYLAMVFNGIGLLILGLILRW